MTVKKRFIGKTNVEVSELGFGTAPLGGWPVEVSDKNAEKLLEKGADVLVAGNHVFKSENPTQTIAKLKSF